MAGVLTVSHTKNIHNANSMTFEERRKDLEIQDAKMAEEEKRKKQSPFKHWVQVNLEHSDKRRWLIQKHAKAAFILDFLVEHMDNYNAVMCSYQVLQELLDVSKETIRKNIKLLKDNGFIAVLKSGNNNVYAVNDSIYWKSWGNNKKYSKFPANIVLSMSEQDKDYQLSFADIEVDNVKTVTLKPSQDGQTDQAEPQDPWGIDD